MAQPENGKLAGKVAVVTGASKGIGAEIAKELAADGAAVVVNFASSRNEAEKVVAAITSAGGRATAIGANVGRPDEVEALFAKTKSLYGKVDILVNNAGKYIFEPLEHVTAEHIASMFDTNVTGLLLATKEAVALMPSEGGCIVNLSSIAGESGQPTASVYGATKGAVNTITRALAKELGPRKIRVNAVIPGVIATEGYANAGLTDSPFEKQMVATTPLGRVGRPDDVASVVTFLVSDEARWVTGSLLDVAGGWR